MSCSTGRSQGISGRRSLWGLQAGTPASSLASTQPAVTPGPARPWTLGLHRLRGAVELAGHGGSWKSAVRSGPGSLWEGHGGVVCEATEGFQWVLHWV